MRLLDDTDSISFVLFTSTTILVYRIRMCVIVMADFNLMYNLSDISFPRS